MLLLWRREWWMLLLWSKEWWMLLLWRREWWMDVVAVEEGMVDVVAVEEGMVDVVAVEEGVVDVVAVEEGVVDVVAVEEGAEEGVAGRVVLAKLVNIVESPVVQKAAGRPCGHGLTVIGLKRKKRAKMGEKRKKRRPNEEVACSSCSRVDPERSVSSGPTEWVECDECHEWYHQVCVSFGENIATFSCSQCM
ncbi:hypothetical protein CAPTEDRAFT_203659 [Capitella teleta]|uniref:Zinc finger PHD-type domain-containing protein n=1 Tax=Capitella teleta TaxID=283909 RepID=R7UBC8_CAPTE|nr:hypothetical protein CAPTEDRAFT_203659 [Capitella teleta]|eukprot:ELU00562.1 hypothetical protein CAPTEDRAFT_203659 [Capitella teleta]